MIFAIKQQTHKLSSLFFFFFAWIVVSCSTVNMNKAGHLVPKTVLEDSSLPRVYLNGTTLHAESFGDPENAVIVFLHGGPGGGGYRSLLRLKGLQDHYSLVFWDQRGAGLSQRHPPDVYNMETYLEDLRQVINHYTDSDTAKVILVGHSWGGQYATAFISKYPERVAKAVLIDPGPFNRELLNYLEFYNFSFRHRWLNEWLWNNDFISPDSHERMDFIRNIGGGAQAEFNAGFHLNTKDPAKGWRLGAIAATALMSSEPNFDFTTGLRNFDHKVLFIRGELNEIHSQEYMQRQMAFYKKAELVTVQDVGHDLQWVKAEEVMAAIRAYLYQGD